MKPSIVCKGFEAPENLSHFMKEAIGEVLKISPYESYLEAYIEKEPSDYIMAITVNHADGKFKARARNRDLQKVVIEGTSAIFDQLRKWWKSRSNDLNREPDRNDWAGNLTPPKYEKPMNLELAFNPLQVLLVDDDIESVTPLEQCLEKLGCTVFVVNNGFEAIHEIVSNQRQYDVVILDWHMPEMTGGQALLNAQRVISYDPAVTSHWPSRKLPVITFSSRSLDEIDVPDCEDFCHLAHWEKPASYLHLLDQAKETFSRIRQ